MIEIVDKTIHKKIFKRYSEKYIAGGDNLLVEISASVERDGDPLVLYVYMYGRLAARLVLEIDDNGRIFCELPRHMDTSMYVQFAVMKAMEEYTDGRYYFGEGATAATYLINLILATYKMYHIALRDHDDGKS